MFPHISWQTVSITCGVGVCICNFPNQSSANSWSEVGHAAGTWWQNFLVKVATKDAPIEFCSFKWVSLANFRVLSFWTAAASNLAHMEASWQSFNVSVCHAASLRLASRPWIFFSASHKAFDIAVASAFWGECSNHIAVQLGWKVGSAEEKKRGEVLIVIRQWLMLILLMIFLMVDYHLWTRA